MKFRLAALALIMSGSTALAADLTYEPAPVVVPVVETFNWTGFYAGVHGGYGWGETRDVNNSDAVGQDIDGWFGGAQVGYNWQLQNNVVLGLEADVSFGNIGESWDSSKQYDPYYGEDKIEAFGTVRARVGYAADRFLPYLTGGLAWAKQDHSLGCSPASAIGGTNGCGVANGGAQFDTSDSSTSIGWVVGAGVEYALTNNWTVKGEYLYTDLGKETVSLYDPNWPGSTERNFDTSFSTVKLGLNYKF